MGTEPGALISAGGGEVVDGDTRLSADAMDDLVARVAGGLRTRGVGPGDAVTWQLPNSVAAAALTRACWRIGAVAAPMLHSFGSAEVAGALGQIDPALVVELDVRAISDPSAIAHGLGGEPVRTGSCPVRPSDVALVLFTSGSTGTPKAVLHTHRGLSWKATLMAEVHGLGHADAVLMPAPMAHISGLLNGVLVPGAAGLRTVLVRRFDPSEALNLVARERISFLAGPPTFFVAMAGALNESPSSGGLPHNVSSIRLVSSGGASVTPAFVEETARIFNCRVKRTYGSTEAPTVTTSTDSDPFEKARDTDGRAVGLVELRVVDPGTEVALGVGQPGELWVRGPEMFAGYADRGQTSSAIARACARSPETAPSVIIRGGENISASEVEAALEAHPSIRQAVAVGYPDPVMGERVGAFVVATTPFDLDECQQWFAGRGMAKFKTPERVEQLDELPLLGSGKPDRASLRDRLAGP